jgi:hypothetical protein
MNKLNVFFALLMAAIGISTAHADTYNPANNQVTIDSIQVGNTIYTGVVITVGSVISVAGSSSVVPAPTTSVVGNYVCTSVAGRPCANPNAYLNLLSNGYWATDGGCGGQYQIAASAVRFLTGGCGAVLWGDATIGPNTLTFPGNGIYTKH